MLLIIYQLSYSRLYYYTTIRPYYGPPPQPRVGLVAVFYSKLLGSRTLLSNECSFTTFHQRYKMYTINLNIKRLSGHKPHPHAPPSLYKSEEKNIISQNSAATSPLFSVKVKRSFMSILSLYKSVLIMTFW